MGAISGPSTRTRGSDAFSTIVTVPPGGRAAAATSSPIQPAPTISRCLGEPGRERQRVVDGAEVGHVGARLIGQRQPARPGAGSQEQPVVGQASITEGDVAGVEVDVRDRLTGDQLDLVVGVPGGGVGEDGVRIGVAEKQPLGERWPLVRGVRLVADQRDVSGASLSAELLGGVGPGETGSDDDDVHGVLLVRARNSARVRGSSRRWPKRAEVVVRAPGVRAPRSPMHVCSASTTTPTPRGSSSVRR